MFVTRGWATAIKWYIKSFAQLLLDSPPKKIIKYRNYKVFNENIFCHELDQTLLKGEIYKSENPYSRLTEIFQENLQRHAPLKSKHEVDMLLSLIKT